MSATEETIAATLGADGQLRLASPPSLPPGPVQVTIRVPAPPRRGLADVLREIAAAQRASGYPGRSDAEIQAELDARRIEDEERDRELDSSRGMFS